MKSVYYGWCMLCGILWAFWWFQVGAFRVQQRLGYRWRSTWVGSWGLAIGGLGVGALALAAFNVWLSWMIFGGSQ